ncbi:hypothetical protein XCR1_4230009 [Xenorhabdus cabanillasii JM26]|uniref:Uncharacterized protein n=1 Tax=Xenorhabdus cabanillasii JM26 TaxID=1427517 RepID=W1JAP8_9GAMM|nr:hypothetical protein XCR1_4230009 [Xenorhabdus cabanillasii JM26]
MLKCQLELLRFLEGPLARVVFTLLYIVLEDYSGILISHNHLS